MKNENLIYLLEVIASTASNDIESDEFEVVWEDQNGMEGWTTESITATAKQAADALKQAGVVIPAMNAITPELAKQFLLAGLLSFKSDTDGSDFEDGTYENGVRDALAWVCGFGSEPLLESEYPEFASNIEQELIEAVMRGPVGTNAGDALRTAIDNAKADGV